MEIGYAQTGSPRSLPNAAPATQAPTAPSCTAESTPSTERNSP